MRRDPGTSLNCPPFCSGLRPDRDTFAEFPGLFPALLASLALGSSALALRRLAHFRTPRSRSAPSTCHPLASRAKGPRENSHNPRALGIVEFAALASLAPSRRLLDAGPAGGASAISRSKRCLHSAGANRTPWCGQDRKEESWKHPHRTANAAA